MQRDNLQGDRGRRSGTKGTLGRPPPIPLAVFPLHSLSPIPQPSPGHRYTVSGKFCRGILFAVSSIGRTLRPYNKNTVLKCNFFIALFLSLWYNVKLYNYDITKGILL